MSSIECRVSNVEYRMSSIEYRVSNVEIFQSRGDSSGDPREDKCENSWIFTTLAWPNQQKSLFPTNELIRNQSGRNCVKSKNKPDQY